MFRARRLKREAVPEDSEAKDTSGTKAEADREREVERPARRFLVICRPLSLICVFKKVIRILWVLMKY